jgi:hypothetical protein
MTSRALLKGKIPEHFGGLSRRDGEVHGSVSHVSTETGRSRFRVAFSLCASAMPETTSDVEVILGVEDDGFADGSAGAVKIDLCTLRPGPKCNVLSSPGTDHKPG